MNKYIRVFTFAARDQTIYLPAFLVRNVFLIVILFVFYSLWRAVYQGRALLAGFSMIQALWYLTFTETVELAKTSVMRDIQEEVKDGSLAYGLTRPYSYVLFKIFRSMGESCVKMLPLMVIGFLMAFAFVGPLPGYLAALPFGIILKTSVLIWPPEWSTGFGLSCRCSEWFSTTAHLSFSG